jgi:ion channel
MPENDHRQTELLLLVSILVIILAYPALDQTNFRRRLIIGGLMFVPVLLATIRLAKIKGWVWPSLFIMLCVLVSTLADMFITYRTLSGIKWGLMAVFFALTVVGLFSHLKKAKSITNSHLYVAMSIYLLLAMEWFSLSRTIEVFYPDSISHASGTMNRESELLYFSLVTLTTIGYGDVVALRGEARMLAALEGMAGVMYVAITVALLVNAYKQQSSSR